MTELRTVIAAGAIVYKDNQVLLVRMASCVSYNKKGRKRQTKSLKTASKIPCIRQGGFQQ